MIAPFVTRVLPRSPQFVLLGCIPSCHVVGANSCKTLPGKCNSGMKVFDWHYSQVMPICNYLVTNNLHNISIKCSNVCDIFLKVYERMKFSSYICKAEQDRGVRMTAEIMLQFSLERLLWSDISKIN